MILKYEIVDFVNLNFDKFKEFSSQYGIIGSISLNLNPLKMGIQISDEKTNTIIFTDFLRKITDKEKDDFLEVNNGVKDEMYNIYVDCDYEFAINVKTPNELRLAYVFAIYMSSMTRMLLINLSNSTFIDNKKLISFTNEMLDTMTKSYMINLKYLPKIKQYEKESDKYLNYSTGFWIILIILSLVSTFLFIVLIFVYNVENILVAGLPFIILGCSILGYVLKDFYLKSKLDKKIRTLYFNHDKEILELYGERSPKKPSEKSLDLKQKIINFLGVMIVLTLIGGSVLMSFEKYVLGLIIIIIPWVLLIGIKVFITDKVDKMFKNSFYEWLTKVINSDISKEVVALHFNLYENSGNMWVVELIGCKSFEPTSTMWTKTSTIKISTEFNFQRNSNWEQIENEIIELLNLYFMEDLQTREKYKAITAGFVDGTISYVYYNEQ